METPKLEDSVTISFGGANHTIKFPTVGQIMDIEQRKQILTANTYGAMVRTSTVASVFNITLTDAIACFGVLIPKLTKELDVKSYLEMPALDGKELVKVYKEQFRPWYNKFLKELYRDIDLDDEDDVEEEKEKESKPEE